MSHRPAATAYDPYEHADRLGILVLHGRIRSANGLWLPDERVIILKRGLRAWHERQTLAHELGHVCLGHAETTPRIERLADRWAARKLIAPDHLADVARMSPDPGVWALELGVTDHLLELYLRDHRTA
ncbi:ImmA/IrrE family metallo-endopeptidase [Rathayibacter sp. AY2B5]|uniref:ImmA/IrrE family metallo-endopeptidase n=1 Tax=Rathayibacter sp. AY2B5 TaxID=2080570 RepID=UPI000CE72467|nr:ImmA/IrrE family metallo-endopeptidase [Rathayibacter sp. AY2B5]PPG38638.1 hypothetical protein C5C30_11715 [Rathayibacter sp. AY2B5]